MGSCLASKHQGRPSPTEALILDVYCFATELKLIAFVPSCFESATACAMRASHYRTGLDKVSEWLVVIVGLYFLLAFRLARAESVYSACQWLDVVSRLWLLELHVRQT